MAPLRKMKDMFKQVALSYHDTPSHRQTLTLSVGVFYRKVLPQNNTSLYIFLITLVNLFFMVLAVPLLPPSTGKIQHSFNVLLSQIQF